ncbi:hemerythrin domain-containing protein [Streptomyces nodosus]
MTLRSEVFIQASETDPAIQARAMIRTGQQGLLAALRPKVALLTELELGADAREAALAALIDFCTGSVRRHLNATDQALYAPAAGSPETRLLIRALRTAATVLDRDIDALTRTDDTSRVKTIAQSIEAHLATHLAVEQAVLLPALTSLPGMELAALAADFTTLLDGGRLDRPADLDVGRAVTDG